MTGTTDSGAQAERALLKAELKQWKAAFTACHGRKPDFSDLPAEQHDKLRRFDELDAQSCKGGSADAAPSVAAAKRQPDPDRVRANMAKLTAARQKVQGSGKHLPLPVCAPLAPTDGTTSAQTPLDPSKHSTASCAPQYRAAAPLPPRPGSQPTLSQQPKVRGRIGSGSFGGGLSGSRARGATGAALPAAKPEGTKAAGAAGAVGWNVAAARQRLRALTDEQAAERGDAVCSEEGPRGGGALRTAGAVGSQNACPPCCEETGCLCLEPGLRCGFAWRKLSSYEEQRDASKLANEAKLRELRASRRWCRALPGHHDARSRPSSA